MLYRDSGGCSGAAHAGPPDPSQLRRDSQYLVGVDRDGFCHHALQIAAETDTLHTDERLLGQYCPEGTHTCHRITFNLCIHSQ